ncbi:MAG TPA: SRPBCC family protein [Nitrososphaera sp.]|nr:SRPBCC family protein [Nitrososphaera sp.]
MNKVNVATTIVVHAAPDRVWTYLCDAHMPTAAPWCFRLGVPTPRECTIVGKANGVGAQRQCRTDKGFIDQRITEWVPPNRLTFVASSDTIGMYKHVKSMQDTFLLESVPGSVAGTRLTRLTHFETTGAFAFFKAWLFKLTVRRLHNYVMVGFKTLAERREE